VKTALENERWLKPGGGGMSGGNAEKPGVLWTTWDWSKVQLEDDLD
jgi:hypothetical protein